MTGSPMFSPRVKIEPTRASGQNGFPPTPRLPKKTRVNEACGGMVNSIVVTGTASPKRGVVVATSGST
jgi:hypothetical protein